MNKYWVYDLPNWLFGVLTIAVTVAIGLGGSWGIEEQTRVRFAPVGLVPWARASSESFISTRWPPWKSRLPAALIVERQGAVPAPWARNVALNLVRIIVTFRE
jgi:hypothetical protein